MVRLGYHSIHNWATWVKINNVIKGGVVVVVAVFLED